MSRIVYRCTCPHCGQQHVPDLAPVSAARKDELAELRRMAAELASEMGANYIIVPKPAPKLEQNAALAYVVAEDGASHWEKATGQLIRPKGRE